METIRTRTHVENGHVTVDVPAHWNNKDIEVVLVAHDVPLAHQNPEGLDPKTGNGAHIMAIAEAIVESGGVVWPMDVMQWQQAERQDRPLPGRR